MNELFYEQGQKWLRSCDKYMAELIDYVGPLQVDVKDDIFGEIIRHILGQQISMQAQMSIWRRWQETFGRYSVAEQVKLSPLELKTVGISTKKAEYIATLIKVVYDKGVDLDALYEQSDEEVIKSLTALPGIGKWTVEMLLLFTLQRENIISYADFGIRQGMCLLYGYNHLTKEVFDKHANSYAPYGSLASLYLWAAVREINEAYYRTKIGPLKLCYRLGKLRSIDFVTTISKGRRNELSDLAYGQIEEYLSGKRREFTIPYEVKGTAFQEKVWAALCRIPYGETRSYQEVAQLINHPKAYRAVGNANNKNPLPLIIPCHRVINANHTIGGYAGGLNIKDMLLRLEKEHK